MTPLRRADISDRQDIAGLLVAIYTRAFTDDPLGPVFVDVAHMDLAAHLPVECDFWDTVCSGPAASDARPLGARGFARQDAAHDHAPQPPARAGDRDERRHQFRSRQTAGEGDRLVLQPTSQRPQRRRIAAASAAAARTGGFRNQSAVTVEVITCLEIPQMPARLARRWPESPPTRETPVRS